MTELLVFAHLSCALLRVVRCTVYYLRPLQNRYVLLLLYCISMFSTSLSYCQSSYRCFVQIFYAATRYHKSVSTFQYFDKEINQCYYLYRLGL